MIPPVRLRAARRGEARAQASWIVGLEPWRSLGYTADKLGAWLERVAAARTHVVHVAIGRDDALTGISVVQEGVLLGDFIALLAVRPEAAGTGVGRALVEGARARSERRWLYTSHDRANRDAALFYKKLGFARVGKLPDMISEGRDEILLRRATSI